MTVEACDLEKHNWIAVVGGMEAVCAVFVVAIVAMLVWRVRR